MKLHEPVSGIIPPLATPLTRDRRLDPAALERLVSHVVEGGVDGIFLLGTTGEGPHLEPEIRSEVIARACRLATGRLPVLVGLCDVSPAANLRLADFAAENNAAGLVIWPPFYITLSQDELLFYLERLVPRLPLPSYLYNIPQHTQTTFEPATVERAAKSLPLAGLKDSSGDLRYFAELRTRLPRSTGFRLLCGPEEKLLDSLRLGGEGGVCGGANLFPALYTAIYRNFLEGREQAAESLQAMVLRLSSAVYARAGGSTGYLRGFKAALAALGICEDMSAEPLEPLPPQDQMAIREFLDAFRRELEPALRGKAALRDPEPGT